MKNRMSVERKSEREIVVTRTINAPPRIVYPSKEALDQDIGAGSTSWNDETFDQLDELLGSASNRE